MKNKTYHNNMNTTQKLYDDDAYATDFFAKVVSCEKKDCLVDGKKTEGFALVLDRTLFFPEEGGQSCDKGTINGQNVCYVSINDEVIEHFVAQPFDVGSEVFGKIDFSHRYRNMQHHSAEHICSGLASSLFGVSNVGFHLGKEFMTMDYDAVFTKEMVDSIEDEANRVIYKNLDISAGYFASQELRDTVYRSKIDIDGDVRIVTIPDVDVCACCAPHVAKTGEIGIIKITHFEKYKGGTRVFVQCADDALRDYRFKNDIVTAMSSLLSAKTEYVSDAAKRLSAENERMSADLAALNKKYCLLLAESYGISHRPVCVFENGIGSGGIRIVANELKKKAPLVVVLDQKENNTYSFVMASEKYDCRNVLTELSGIFAAKGGGSERMIQGTLFGDRKNIEKFFRDSSFD